MRLDVALARGCLTLPSVVDGVLETRRARPLAHCAETGSSQTRRSLGLSVAEKRLLLAGSCAAYGALALGLGVRLPGGVKRGSGETRLPDLQAYCHSPVELNEEQQVRRQDHNAADGSVRLGSALSVASSVRQAEAPVAVQVVVGCKVDYPEIDDELRDLSTRKPNLPRAANAKGAQPVCERGWSEASVKALRAQIAAHLANSRKQTDNKST